MPEEIEICYSCDQPTGRAGRTEDSIYTTFVVGGDEVGPLCFPCYRRLVYYGIIVEQ